MDFLEKLRRKSNSLFGTNIVEETPSLAKNAVIFRASGRNEGDLPPNAKPLDRRLAYGAIISSIRREPGTDNFLLVHGTKILAVMAAVSGCAVLFSFRRAVMIKRRANFMYYAGVSILPLGGLTVVRSKYFDEPVTLGTFQCLPCIQVRSALFQLCAGFIYPLICAPIASIATARRHLTYSTTPLTRLPHGTDLVRSVLNVRRDWLLLIVVFNIIVSSGIARRQWQAATTFHVQHNLSAVASQNN